MSNYENVETVYESELSFIDDLAYKDGNLFTGIAHQDCKYIGNYGFKYPDDAIWIKFMYFMPYKEGRKVGNCKAYYENKQLKYSVQYEDGKKNGRYESWYLTGKREQKGLYCNGGRHGLWRNWYENNCLESEVLFTDDKLQKGKWWFENSQLKLEKNCNGIHENTNSKVLELGWYDNGQLRLKVLSKKNKEELVRKEWHLNGRLQKKEITCPNNLKFIFERSFYQNDLVKSECKYRIDFEQQEHLVVGEKKPHIIKKPNKIHHGKHKYWSIDGRISSTKKYYNDELHGKHKTWNNQGRQIEEVNYANDKKHGENKFWDFRGNCLKIIIYNNGTFIQEKYFFKTYYRHTYFTSEEGNKKIVEYRRFDGQLLEKSKWPKTLRERYHDDDFKVRFNDTFYNDQLDMDQQSPEFWDSI